MKKLLLLAAVTTLVACSSNDVKNDIEEREIGFDANTYKITRAEITDNAALANAGGFIVWGYKAKSQETMNWATEAHTVFNGVNVTASANNGAYISSEQTNWTYATKKYWDKNAKYCFYAAAPYKDNTFSVSDAANNAKMIIITGATSGLASASDDFLIARGGVKNRAGSDQTSNVDFTFNHTMTKVDFLLKKGNDVTGEVKVQSITMTGWDNGTGKFTQSSDNTPTSLDKSEWELTSTSAGSVSILTGETAALTTTAAKSTTQDYIMVPQAIAANTLTFTINFTVDGEPFNGHVGKIAAAQTWGTDSHFTYTLTIAPETIEFDVKSIAGFNNVTSGSLVVQ
ncbi:MAG: fimbrillin family protein [Bacteroidaceae bacterium]|nr:fimbrillin family protein [Bacteroidaceae bacterium]